MSSSRSSSLSNAPDFYAGWWRDGMRRNSDFSGGTFQRGEREFVHRTAEFAACTDDPVGIGKVAQLLHRIGLQYRGNPLRLASALETQREAGTQANFFFMKQPPEHRFSGNFGVQQLDVGKSLHKQHDLLPTLGITDVFGIGPRHRLHHHGARAPAMPQARAIYRSGGNSKDGRKLFALREIVFGTGRNAPG